MTKKGQVSQAFTYIVIVLLIGLIVVVGYKGIRSIIFASCEEQRASFESTLLGDLEKYTDKESGNEISLSMPCEATELCVVDFKRMRDSLSDQIIKKDSVMRSSIEDGTHNIFIKTKFTEAVGLSQKIVTDPAGSPVQCFKAKDGKVRLLLSGQGRTVLVSSLD